MSSEQQTASFGQTSQTSEASLAPPSVLLAAAEAFINRVLRLDPEGAAGLAKVQGQVLRVELVGLGLHLCLVPEGAALRLFGDYEAMPDCLVRATPAALLSMALAEHREDEIFSGAVQIDGDHGLAQTIGEVLKGLDIDWEEQLATLVGDNIAHQIGHQARAGSRWAERSRRTLQTDLREYLIEEGRFLPSESEMQGFLAGVDRLRDDVERLEARVERLSRQSSQGTGTDPT
ncbi:MAG: SCP2 sterol-binding domain-containing protein [Lamprobacter sp.]|uniref:ubiquinone biosynthesis accessory factor UbiJ n=1 Tax=Lamprobacter sp. TaxID=3100796 RepID=UPI002B26306D|nr:SCP2 sterol-binding domain-containing protein [Lamprobacter sp.]MEA3639194.1 SCP2 sterol-binding domain-containing protein [Lamprobacter sp.]